MKVSARSIASLLALSLLSASSASQPGDVVDAPPAKGYEILSTLTENSSPVAVVRRNDVLFMTYDATIIGAEFDDPYLRKQAAYPGFAIMQCVRYIDREITKAVQIGLGIGTVPTFLRESGVPTDVVEISSAVVRQAANYFQYENCQEDDPEECTHGTTYITDGLKFIENAPAEPQYDAFLMDVYTGWNPVAFFVKEVVDTVHAKWLKPRGVFVVNFVGFINGEHAAVPKSIRKTLLSSFPHVKVFREMANKDEEGAGNIVFFASDEPFTFNVPTDGEYADPPAQTYFDVVKNFQKWEIFTGVEDKADTQEEVDSIEVEVTQPLDAEEVGFVGTQTKRVMKEDEEPNVQVLTKRDHGAEVFKTTHEYTQEHMQERVIMQFPPEMWNELGVSTE